MARGIGGRGPANIMKHMKGIHFPADKEDLIDIVQSGPGPDTGDVLNVVKQLPAKQYDSPADVLHEIGKIE